MRFAWPKRRGSAGGGGGRAGTRWRRAPGRRALGAGRDSPRGPRLADRGRPGARWQRPKRAAASPSGNRTPVSRVTGGDTHHYTNEDGGGYSLRTTLSRNPRLPLLWASCPRPASSTCPPGPLPRPRGSMPARTLQPASHPDPDITPMPPTTTHPPPDPLPTPVALTPRSAALPVASKASYTPGGKGRSGKEACEEEVGARRADSRHERPVPRAPRLPPRRHGLASWRKDRRRRLSPARRAPTRSHPPSGWPSGLRRCVQVAVSPGGVGSNPTPDTTSFWHAPPTHSPPPSPPSQPLTTLRGMRAALTY